MRCDGRNQRRPSVIVWNAPVEVQVEELHGDKGINDLASASNTFSPSVLTS